MEELFGQKYSKRSITSIINLCPHDISVYTGDGEVIHFATLGAHKALRLEEEAGRQYINEEGIPESSPSTYVGLNYLPEPGSRVIVSQLVAVYLKEHQQEYKLRNVYAPDTGPNGVCRNDAGQIVGTKRLIKYV